MAISLDKPVEGTTTSLLGSYILRLLHEQGAPYNIDPNIS